MPGNPHSNSSKMVSNSAGGDTFFDRLKRKYSRIHNNLRFRATVLVLAVYGFLLSINTMGAGFEGLGEGFGKSLENAFDDPFAAFCIGILVTGIIQSSSGTTSLLVALVAAGDLEMELAIPAVMGANIGTAVTNIIVSLGHFGRKDEFRLAFGGSLVHDFFNVIAVIILLPIELIFHPLEKMARGMEGSFGNLGGLKVASPIKLTTEPLIQLMGDMVEPTGHEGLLLIITGAILLFLCLRLIVCSMRLFMMEFAQKMVDRYLFRGPLYSFALGLGLTASVQSSSITTSLLVPLQGAGILKIEKILPFTIGANIGTTVTAILAALATADGSAITLAFAHLCFNVVGGAIIYGIKPLRALPPMLGKLAGDFAVDSKYGFPLLAIGCIGGMIYIMPVVYLIFTGAIRIPI